MTVLQSADLSPVLLSILLLIPLGFLSLVTGAVGVLGSIFGGGSKKKLAQQQANFNTQLNNMRQQMNLQMSQQAQASKKTLTTVIVAGIGIVIFIFMFLKK